MANSAKSKFIFILLIFIFANYNCENLKKSSIINKRILYFDNNGYKKEEFLPCLDAQKKPGKCKQIINCAYNYNQISSNSNEGSICKLKNGQRGICCVALNFNKKYSFNKNTGIIKSQINNKLKMPKLNRRQIFNAVREGMKKHFKNEEKHRKFLTKYQTFIEKNSPAYFHQRLLKTSKRFLNMGRKAQLNLEVSSLLAKKYNLSKGQILHGLKRINLKGTLLSNNCPKKFECDENYKYRNLDGSCNNLKRPSWGKAGIPMKRILSPEYADNIKSPRIRGSNGDLLPSPRTISKALITDENRPYGNYTLFVMQFGQFINHDISHTPISKGPNHSKIACCNNNRVPIKQRHPECFPIKIDGNDSFYGNYGETCMEFVRSLPAQNTKCELGPRQQMNQITAYIDASNVYGSTDKRGKILRDKSGGGRLHVQKYLGKTLLPSNPKECMDTNGERFCFKAGDLRVNEQVELAVIHTVFLKEHNRIAKALEDLNPHWDDLTIYQETRKICIAVKQHIIYNEFLHLIIGPNNMYKYYLFPSEDGFKNLYDPNVNPGISNAFTTAAFRLHTMVQGIVKGFNEYQGLAEIYPILKTQFTPYILYDSYDLLLRGLTIQPAQKFDYFVTNSLTEHLFQGKNDFGLDLISLNIQRGRDHGLPPFISWRKVCGLSKIENWDDLENIMEKENVKNLRSVYKSVDDIDLFVGGLGEKSEEGAIVGPTFACIISDQFSRLRRGDRFFYEEEKAGFTQAQLQEIKKSNLARIICDNSDEIKKMQALVFHQISHLNEQVSCNSEEIARVNLGFWKEII